MYMNKDFDKYYYDFLGALNLNNTEKVNIIPCDKRNKPLNKIFVYPLIVSFFKENVYLSISPEYYIPFKEYIEKFNINNINKTRI